MARDGRSDIDSIRWNARLKAEGLDAKAKVRRAELAATARKEIAERRKLRELRMKPSYAQAEAQQSFEPETCLIKAEELPTTSKGREQIPRPTFAEMREQSKKFPPVPEEVRERKAAARERRRNRRP